MSNRTLWFVGLCALIIFAIVANKIDPKRSASTAETATTRPAICSTLSAESDRALIEIVYKIDGGYMVYVEPVWYGLKIDQKQMFAGYVARCKLKDAARFLDSRSGKLLAKWVNGQYVGEE